MKKSAACQLVSLFRTVPPGFTAHQAAAKRLLEVKHTLNKHTDLHSKIQVFTKRSKENPHTQTRIHAEYIHSANMEKVPQKHSHSDANANVNLQTNAHECRTSYEIITQFLLNN